MPSDAVDFRPSASWPALVRRAALLRQVREFFDARGFVEVETPILSADVVVDRHLDPFATALAVDSSRPELHSPLWLQTSPEFAMKRLLAAGAGSIYQVARAFRQGEIGRRHNPEFTIVEWYGLGHGYFVGMQLLSDLCETLLARGPAERLTYQSAFVAHAGIDPLAAETEAIVESVRAHGIASPASLNPADRDAWLDLLLVEKVEPQLGFDRPVILCDYPPSQAALAQVRPGPQPVAERFELYVAGLELSNGYHELQDAGVLRERNRVNNALRAADGKPTLPDESRLLAAMEHGLPDCTGVALGFDRVVMLAMGADSIADVLAFPIDRA